MLSGRAAGAVTEARTQPVAELDLVGQLLQLVGVRDDTLCPERLRERRPVVGLHVVLGMSTKRLIRSHHRAGGLDDVAFRGERPQIADLVRAGSAQLFGPAAVVEEQQPAAIVQYGFVSRRHRDATRSMPPPAERGASAQPRTSG